MSRHRGAIVVADRAARVESGVWERKAACAALSQESRPRVVQQDPSFSCRTAHLPPPHSYTALTFTDFLEALGRVADMKSMPTASALDEAGYNTILEW